MAKADKILAIDIGATSIKLCEFDFSDDKNVTLTHFAHREYEEELSESTRMGVVAGLLRQMLAEGNFTARKALICMSGQNSLVRFNRLPTVNCDRKKIRQLAEFEATQNIPFAIQDVLWDFQLVANGSDDSVDIMSVVIKNEIVDQFTAAIKNVDCEPILIDVAPAASYNVARACGAGEGGECNIILNIGGRVTNLIFCEGERFYARTIPIAGYTITQQIAKEFSIGLPEAEELKRRHGFVALGGAYAEPESETAANVSKIVRNVMSRLLGEITRTINVYRAQQKGNKPSKMYLTGGSSILTYSDTFFSEKLGITVEYFNPFRCVSIADSVDKDKLIEVGHMFSEAIGLGLRYAMSCPLELSLIPASIRRQQQFDSKKPFFLLAFGCILFLLLIVWYGLTSRGDSYEKHAQQLKKIEDLQAKKYINPIEAAIGNANASKEQVQTFGTFLRSQSKWPSILNEIYRIKPDNLWITSIEPIVGEVKDIVKTKKSEEAMGGDGMGGMFGGGMFEGGDFSGMMGMGGGDGGQSAGPSGATATIGGLKISGTSVMPNKAGVTFTIGKAFEFPFEVPSKGEEQPAEEGDQTAAKLTPEQRMANAMKNGGTTTEEVFLTALKESNLFDPDSMKTDFTYYAPSSIVRNYTNFTIQVKFAFPLEFFEIKNRANNGSSGGKMGF